MSILEACNKCTRRRSDNVAERRSTGTARVHNAHENTLGSRPVWVERWTSSKSSSNSRPSRCASLSRCASSPHIRVVSCRHVCVSLGTVVFRVGSIHHLCHIIVFTAPAADDARTVTATRLMRLHSLRVVHDDANVLHPPHVIVHHQHHHHEQQHRKRHYRY